MTDVKEHIVKVVLCTNDRTNQSDDTSDCRFTIEGVQNVESFCLRRALVPLSSYSFSPVDPDSNLIITNEGQYPNGVYDTSSSGAKYVNYFGKPTGVVFNANKTFNDATKDVTVRMAWMFLPANSNLSIGYQLAGGVPYIRHTVLTNSTSGTVYYSFQQILDALNYGIQTMAGFGASGVVVKCSVFGEAPQAGDATQRVQFTQALPSAGTPYFYCDWRKPAGDVSWFGMQGFSVWLQKPGTAYDSTIGGFSLTSDLIINRISPQTLTRLPGTPLVDGILDREDRTVSFLTTQAYTTAQIISTFNADPAMDNILGINLTQLAIDPTGMPNNRFYLYNNFGASIPERFLKASKYVFDNETLGFVRDNGYKIWLTTMGSFNPANVIIAVNQPNLSPDIILRSIPIPSTGNVMDQLSFQTLVNSLINPDGFEMFNDIDYLNINQGGSSSWTGADLASLDALNRYVYGWRFIRTQTRFDLGGVVLSNTPLTDLIYVPSFWLNKHAQMQPTQDTNTYAVNNLFYLHSRPSYQSIQMPLNTVATLAGIQTALNNISAPLVATIQTASDTILFTNSGLGTYRIKPNKTLGVYDDSQSDQYFEITPNESRNTSFAIDLSCDNSFMAIGLNLYHDGRCSLGLPDSKNSNSVRPSRKNIVATLHNLSEKVYGGHIAYVNDSDVWLPSYVKDLSEMHLSVYNTKLELAALNKQDVFLEIDLKCSTYRV